MVLIFSDGVRMGPIYAEVWYQHIDDFRPMKEKWAFNQNLETFFYKVPLNLFWEHLAKSAL